MTTRSPGRPASTGHELLLRLAGRIPDSPLAGARRLLAEGDVPGAMAGPMRWLAGDSIPLLADELAAIRVLAGDPAALSGVQPVRVLPELPFAFSPLDQLGRVERDAMDDAVAATAQGHGIAGLWRSWRYRLDDPDAAAATVTVDPDDPDQAYRVYLAQVDDVSGLDVISRDLLRAVGDTGAAGTEIILLGEDPPPYQSMALAESALLWASPGEPEFELAAVFDFADPVSGPGFAPDHAVVGASGEREQLLAYLRGGALVLTATATMDDVLDPAAGAVVPASFRTDGEWIWTDTAEYYLSRHGLALDGGLDRHIRGRLARGEVVPLVDAETAGRATDFLLRPPARGHKPGLWTGQHLVASHAERCSVSSQEKMFTQMRQERAD